MGLHCAEHGHSFQLTDTLWAATREDLADMAALCELAIDGIPASERRTKPCTAGERGIDIHRAYSRPNGTSFLTITSFTIDDFFFSISQEIAERYLPNCSRDIIARLST